MSIEYRRSFYRHSIDHPEDFWAEQGQAIDWRKGWNRVLDFSDPPLARWFVGGETNLCHNAVDRHLREREHQNALVYISTETDERQEYTYRELYREVNAFAAALKELGVGRGDRVVMYMPMMAEAVFSMLACVRLGAVHSSVFRGCPSAYLAGRVDGAQPRVVVTADADMSGGNAVPCKQLVDEALEAARFTPEHIVVCRRGLGGPVPMIEGRDLDYTELRERHLDEEIPVEWVDSSHPSYVLHTSGATGVPRLVQRDTGGHAVSLAASMRHVFASEPGDTMFTASAASDVGWVVGHSYIVYAPLLYGMTSIVYEGLPTRPDPGVWWNIVEEHRVNTMLTSPTAIRALRKHGNEHMREPDTSSLQNLFLVGEPLDEPTSRWVSESLGVAVRDTYWQTETGWPVLSSLPPGPEDEPVRPVSAAFPCHGYDLRLMNEETGEEVSAGESGVLMIAAPLPPGCASAAQGGNDRFIETYFSDFTEWLYSTFDWAKRDLKGCYSILGRSNDVIEVPGRRFGTREIEEAISDHEDVQEVAAVTVDDKCGGQATIVYVVLRDGNGEGAETSCAKLGREIKDAVEREVGIMARPDSVRFVRALPRTRSGKMLHRCMRAIVEGRDVGDLSTLKNPDALEAVRAASSAEDSETANVIEHRGEKA